MNDKKQTISIELPNPITPSLAVFSTIKNRITTLFSTSYSNFQGGLSNGVSSAKKFSFRLPKIKLPSFRKFNFDKKNTIKIAVPIIGVIALVFVATQAFRAEPSIQGISQIATDKPLATQELNREFSFPLRDEEGEEAGSFKYIIESAEKRKQIIVKGERATAVEGRVFLILNLKLINELNQGININTRDYVRVYVNGNQEELLAPDIHNDPVEAQAISTKNTRVGLAINEDDRDVVLRIGEIDGEKEEIKLSL